MPLEMDDFRAPEVPTLEKLLGSTPLHDAPGSAEPSFTASAMGASVLDALGGHARTTEPNAPTPPGGGGNVILDAFNALLAMEQGEPRPSTRPHGAAGSTMAVTDELVDEVARRVIERLAPNTARELVRQVVSDVAERLIREEITRIKSAADTKR